MRELLATPALDNGDGKARRRCDSLPRVGPQCFQEVVHFTAALRWFGKNPEHQEINRYTEQIFQNILVVLSFKCVGCLMGKPQASDSVRTHTNSVSAKS